MRADGVRQAGRSKIVLIGNAQRKDNTLRTGIAKALPAVNLA